MSDGDHDHHGTAKVVPLGIPFLRQAELEDIRHAIDDEDCQAVILRYETGLGASTVLRHLAEEEASGRAVLTIHGTPSLSSVPYGALAPLLGELDGGENLSVRTNVFRAVLAAIHASAAAVAGASGRPLVIVDDAHTVDRSTAELLMTLVLSGTIQLVASHLREKSLPEPLPQLWIGGSAEIIELFPLTREQGQEFCESMLSAPIALPASWYFWSCSGGNPMLLKMLVAEALEDESLTQSRGIWVYQLGHHRVGRNLREVVNQQIRGLSAPAAAALDLVALAEPVARDMVAQVSGQDALTELLERHLVRPKPTDDSLLTLANPIYGDVIRQMVPPARSRILHDRLMEKLDAQPMGIEALLRSVSWAVDSGLTVPEDRLLRAALIACKLSQPTLALELLDHITAPDRDLKVRAVQARAHYLMGSYVLAAELLDDVFDAASTLDELLFASLLRATTRLALGMPAARMREDLNKFLAAGERLVRQSPGQAAVIRDHVSHKRDLLELLMLSQKGDYPRMLPLIESVLAGNAQLPEQERLLNESIALAMDAERLCALGLASESQQRCAEAFALKRSEVYDVFFIPEMIVFRQLTTALCTGDLPFAAELLDTFFVNAGPMIITFGGGANVARGMGLIRQGLLEEAVAALLPAIESLRISDPQQLLGFCVAMAAYAAARLGQTELARRLIGEHQETPAMFLITAHERAFMAAAGEYCARDGAGLETLLVVANSARDQQAHLLELNALALAVELGETSLVGRLRTTAPKVEGAWSAAILHFCEQLDAAQQPNAASAAPPLGKRALPRVNQHAWFSGEVLDASERSAPASGSASVPEPVKLTRREREIAKLAVAGLSDRAIAEKLFLSTRTVGGHLYRCYAKLGIAGRDELTPDLFS